MCTNRQRTMKRIFCLLFLFVSLSGCLITEWEDVSNESKYIKLIGLELITKETMRAHGITMEPNYEKILSHYSITPLPGFSGPEVLSVTILPVGTKVKIVKVVRCIDCFIKEVDIELRLIEGPSLYAAPSRFDYEYFIENKDRLFTVINEREHR